MSSPLVVGELGGPEERDRCDGTVVLPLCRGVEAEARPAGVCADDGRIPLDSDERAKGVALLVLLYGVDGPAVLGIPIFARLARGVEGAPSRLGEQDRLL